MKADEISDILGRRKHKSFLGRTNLGADGGEPWSARPERPAVTILYGVAYGLTLYFAGAPVWALVLGLLILDRTRNLLMARRPKRRRVEHEEPSSSLRGDGGPG